MKNILAIIIITFAFSGCTMIQVNKKNVAVGNVPPDTRVGTVSKLVASELKAKGERPLLMSIGDDNVTHFLGLDGQQFKFGKHKPKGTLRNTITIKRYSDSPNCFEIFPGDGTSFWYPASCP